MLIVTVPAVAITRSFLGGKTELLALTVLFDLITLMVLFFGFMFFRIIWLFGILRCLISKTVIFQSVNMPRIHILENCCHVFKI